MKKITLRVVCFMITLICILTALPIASSAKYDIDSTYVMDDLEKLSDFNLEKYTKNENEQYVSLIAFHEYGYDYNKNFSDYGLYVYLYNPSGKPIISSNANLIYMKVGGSYKRYILIPVSYSVESGYEHVFYKFKVQTDAEFVNSLSLSKRVYDINGIDLYYKGVGDSTYFNNKYLFYYTGYDSYHGPKGHAASTLHCTTDTEETVSLQLHGASWKTDTSDKGINHQYEITSVYFAVPNYFLNKYGSKTDLYKGLYALTAEWYEYKTNGLITNNSALYGDALGHVNKTDSDLSKVDESIPFQFHVCHDELNMNGDGCAFNHKNSLFDVDCPMYVGAPSVCGISKLCNVIFEDYETFKGFDAEETKEHLLKNDGTVNCFTFVDDGRTCGYNKKRFTVEDGPLNSQIKNYASTHKGKFWHDLQDWLDRDYDNPFNDPGVTDPIETFHKVTASDFSGGTTAENAYKLFLSEADYENLKDYYNEVDEDEYTVYLLRFAVTDYVCGLADVNPIKGSVNYGSDNYYFEKTVFLQFDVLDMTFRDEFDNYVTLPVEADPIDILGTIDPPTTEDPEPSDLLETLLAKLELLIAVIVIFAVVYIAFKGWDAFKDVLDLTKNKKQ